MPKLSDVSIDAINHRVRNAQGMGHQMPDGLDHAGMLKWADMVHSFNDDKMEGWINSGQWSEWEGEHEHKSAPFDPNRPIKNVGVPSFVAGTGAYALKGVPSLLNSGNAFNWKLGVPELGDAMKNSFARAGRQAGAAVSNAKIASAGSSAAEVAARNLTTVAKAGTSAPAVKAGLNVAKAAGNVVGGVLHAVPIYDAYRAADAMHDEYNNGFRGQYNGGSTLGNAFGIFEAGANALTLGGYDATRSAFSSGKNGQGGYGDVNGVESDPYGAGKLGERIGEFFFPNNHPAKQPQQNLPNYQYLGHP